MQPIEIRTFRQILERKYTLDCWCPGCRRWAACDVAQLVRQGLGDRAPMDCRPRCRKCGSVGEWQLKPPVPTAPDQFHA